MNTPVDHNWTEIAEPGTDLLLRRLVVGPLSTNCYLVGSQKTKQSVLIDPGAVGAEAATILDSVSDMNISMIVLTHTHFDHVEALAEVAVAQRQKRSISLPSDLADESLQASQGGSMRSRVRVPAINRAVSVTRI